MQACVPTEGEENKVDTFPLLASYTCSIAN